MQLLGAILRCAILAGTRQTLLLVDFFRLVAAAGAILILGILRRLILYLLAMYGR